MVRGAGERFTFGCCVFLSRRPLLTFSLLRMGILASTFASLVPRHSNIPPDVTCVRIMEIFRYPKGGAHPHSPPARAIPSPTYYFC